MGRIFNPFKTVFTKKQKEETSNVEELRIAFRSRYHYFKLLLNANNSSLEIMAEIEQALFGKVPFGMSFIRSNSTAVSVNVFSMIKNLVELAPEKYNRLFVSFNDIQQRIDKLLKQKKQETDKRLIIPLSSINKNMADLVGSKMANLGEIKNEVNLMVPGGFAITSAAYQRFIEHNDLQAEIDRRFQSADLDHIDRLYTLSAEIQQLIIRSEPPENLSNAIRDAYIRLEKEVGRGINVALRSSALGEDTAGTSFAGQYRTQLNVSSENLVQAYKEVIASKYSLPAITYRLNRGFRDEDISMGVGCIAMIEAIAGGVTYSRNPVDLGNDSIFINSAWGLPESVVDGSIACDLFVVSRKSPMTITHEDIKSKEKKSVCFPEEGVCRIVLTGESKDLPSINREQVLTLAELAVRIEGYYSSPQDIEWAIDNDGSLYILQCRPLQQMEAAKKFFSEETKKPEKDTIIVKGGMTASSGAACGTVYIANRGVDILQFPKGAVLVTQQALPRWASLLNRAVAVITEQGGFAGHLANVAREFEVPALFGVQGIRDKLKTGDLITVDADGLTIYMGKRESVLSDPRKKKNLMKGSPVYNTLKHVSKHIIPLNLLDPDSSDFSPSNCKTFHDITRFVHEKSVHEMFDFGKENNFSEKSSKQLFYKVAMQWWVLNLDDGYKKDVKGKYVKLEDIVSIPMLAFWAGFTAVPWEGPPAIDGKGFMSVIFRSTQNVALTPGIRSPYADKNYFMISKNYCSLNSRLGYHFCTMEALVSDRPHENYISFQFKGGAADYQRRLKRVLFIKNILEEFDYRVDVREDNLIARVEDQEKGYMEKKLEILGYLSLHTRQLDMIMSNDASVDYYRSKFNKDIRDMLNSN